MNADRLIEWSDLHARRQRAAARGLAAVPPGIYALIAGFLFVAEVGRRLVLGDPVAGVLAASGLWVGVAAVANVIAVFGAPFRMWWRADAAYVARLAIPGEALVSLGFARSRRTASAVFLPCALAALAFGPLASWELALRHLALAGAGFAAVALLGPASAVFGGATVASDRAQAAVASVAGDVSPPKTTYLGLFPSLSAAGLFVAFLASGRWAATGIPGSLGDGLAIPAAVVLASVLAAAVAVRLAPRVGNAAAREVAALDYERLAHIERTSASASERAAARLVGGDAALVADKDARLIRRRYPAPFFVLPLLVLGMWIAAATGPDESPTWVWLLLGSAGVYNAVLGARLGRAPTEHPRLLRTLAVAAPRANAGKRALVVARVIMSVLLGGVPMALASDRPAVMGALVAAVALVSAVAGARLASVESPSGPAAG